MTTAMITSKGQIAIPKDVRSLKGIVPKPKQPVTIKEMNQAIAEKGASQ